MSIDENLLCRHAATRRYSAKTSTLATSSNRPSAHAARILAGSPEKKTPQMRTLVPRTTFIRAGARCGWLFARRRP